MLCSTLFCFVLFSAVTCNVLKSRTIVESTSDDSELGSKVAELKNQALELLALKGAKGLDQNAKIKSDIHWDDIKITKELYKDIKSSFDQELAYLKKKKAGVRTTAPNFALIPWAKWPMPILFTTTKIKSSSLKSQIREALNEIEGMTGCITFEEVTYTPSKPYIQYKEVATLGEGVCADSYLGKQDDVNVINVATTCQVYGTLIHETMHSLGFAHTQQRPDASTYITINYGNMVQDAGLQSNFQPWRYAAQNQGPFDFGSVMMYPPTAFSRKGGETITPKIDPTYFRKFMGQRDGLSSQDAKTLVKYYCDANTPTGASCKDKAPHCATWKTNGYCASSSEYYLYVTRLCRVTCKVC